MGSGTGYGLLPGHDGVLWVYLPPGEHAPGSLPCVVIAPAGSNGLSGMALTDGDRPEHVPYARQGIAVVAYSLDGPVAHDGDARRALGAFRKARAGLVNARNALDYVLDHVPEVDPQRIFAAGHSSAGGVALLVAAHEPRLAGVMAYAPSLRPATAGLSPAQARRIEVQLPGVTDLAVRGDPFTHVGRISCPVFLFHAEDDGLCSIRDTREFAEALRTAGVAVTLETVASGGHYSSMLNPGIPLAIEWLEEQMRTAPGSLR